MTYIKKILEFKRKDLEPTKSFEVNETLNPDVWNEDHTLKEGIRERLLEIAEEFIDTIYGDIEVLDIVLIGSLASYNWSQYSDFDVHVVIDYKDINEDEELVEEYLKLLKKKWNSSYDITIHGYEVELYAEDKDVERSHINGLYSIMNDEWIIEPNIENIKEVDTKLIESKAVLLMNQIDDIEAKADTMSYEELKDETDRIWDKIKKARRDGINSPDGEFAVGNLVFKYLRRNNYISKVIYLKKKLIEDKFTI